MPLIPLWLRLAAVLALATAVFFSGWNYRASIADADIAHLKLAHEQAMQEADDAARADVEKAEANGRAVATDLAEKLKRQRGASTVIHKEISREEVAAVAAGSVRYMPFRWVRLYDDALRSGDPSNAAAEPAGSSGWAGVADAEYSPVSEWDALRTHAVNASRWAACRAQLNALIDAVTAGDPVVTGESVEGRGLQASGD